MSGFVDPEANQKPGSLSQSELDAFLRFLSHDLRAPLRGIEGYSQALIDDYGEKLDPLAKAYLKYIHESSHNLSDMIDGLLKLYRIGRSDLLIEPVNLSELASEIIRDFQLEYPERSVRFNFTPSLIAQADRNLMTQLLTCLIENALKFTSFQPEAELELNAFEKAGERVYFLRDNGVGFQMSYQDKLFLPFQKLHAHHEYPGLGLGLAIAQKIVAQHSGKIWAEAEPGLGATFFFTIHHPNI